jgi:hypothetical protein
MNEGVLNSIEFQVNNIPKRLNDREIKSEQSAVTR